MDSGYEVIDEGGVTVGGKVYNAGERLPAGVLKSQVAAFERFGQVRKVQAKKKAARKKAQ